MMKKIFLIYVSILLSLPTMLLADETKLDQIFTPFVEQTMEEHNVQGFVMSVVSKDEVLYQKTFGIKKPFTQLSFNNTGKRVRVKYPRSSPFLLGQFGLFLLNSPTRKPVCSKDFEMKFLIKLNLT